MDSLPDSRLDHGEDAREHRHLADAGPAPGLNVAAVAPLHDAATARRPAGTAFAVPTAANGTAGSAGEAVGGDAGDAVDVSALAWVHDELRRLLEQAHKTLRRVLRETAALAGADVDAIDPGVLRSARALLHQGVGALELIGMPEAARVLRASETALHRCTARPSLLKPALLDAIERLSFALIDYLGRLRDGKPVQPLSLFPQYRAVQEAVGAERVHPADLWRFDWEWRRVPVALADRGALQPRRPDAAARGAMEPLMLALMRQPTLHTFQRMSDLCAELAAGASADDDRELPAATSWALAAAVFEAQAQGRLAPDVFSKRVASRLLAQLRVLERGEHDVSERLAQDLLFFCAQARPVLQPPVTLDGDGSGSGGADAADASPRLAAVRRAYALPAAAPVVDYSAPMLGRFDPAWIAQARKRVASAKESWSAVAGGEQHRLSGLAEQFALVGDSLQRLFPGGDVLAGELQQAVASTHDANAHTRTHPNAPANPHPAGVPHAGSHPTGVPAGVHGAASETAPPSPALAMEVATALLYIDACLEEGDFDDAALGQRVRRLAQRIAAARGAARAALAGSPDGGVGEPLEAWMEELYRRVSDRQTMGSVVRELRASLAGAESSIDRFFRQPRGDATARSGLLEVPAQLASMRGVMSVLGLEHAVAALLRMRDDVDGLIDAAPVAAAAGVLPAAIAGAATAGNGAAPATAVDAASAGDAAAAAPDAARAAVFDRLAGNLGALGFLIDMLGVQPQLAKALFAFDNEAGTLNPVMGRGSRPIALPPVADAAPPLPAVLPPAPPSPGTPPSATAPTPQVQSSPSSPLPAGLPPGPAPAGGRANAPTPTPSDPSDTVAAGLLQPIDVRMSEFMTTASGTYALGAPLADPDDIAFAPPAAELPPVAATAAAAAATVAPASPASAGADDEMRGVFLEEAREVLSNARADWQSLPHADDPLPALTALRRAFHTLKGSARMVGLDEFGAAAWACEQWFNECLAQQAGAEPALLDFTGWVLGQLSTWVDDIAAGRPSSHTSEAVRQAIRDAPRPPAAVPDAAFDAPADPPAEPAAEPWAAAPAGGLLQLEPQPQPQQEPPWQPQPETPRQLQPPWLAEPQPASDAESKAAGAPQPAAQEDPLSFEFAAFDLPALDFAFDSAPPALSDAEEPQGFGPGPASAAVDTPGAATQREAAVESGFGFEAKPETDAIPVGIVEEADALVDDAAALDLFPADEHVKVVGPLRIGIALFNIYLNEADELSRRLATELAEWALEWEPPMPDSTVALAHSLAGSSATVGYADLSQLARTLEHALARSGAIGSGSAEEAALFVDAADEIRHLLHQFAAGFLKAPSAELLRRLAAHELASGQRLDALSALPAAATSADERAEPTELPADVPPAAAPPAAASSVDVPPAAASAEPAEAAFPGLAEPAFVDTESPAWLDEIEPARDTGPLASFEPPPGPSERFEEPSAEALPLPLAPPAAAIEPGLAPEPRTESESESEGYSSAADDAGTAAAAPAGAETATESGANVDADTGRSAEPRIPADIPADAAEAPDAPEAIAPAAPATPPELTFATSLQPVGEPAVPTAVESPPTPRPVATPPLPASAPPTDFGALRAREGELGFAELKPLSAFMPPETNWGGIDTPLRALADEPAADEVIDAVDAIDDELFGFFEEEGQELLPELAARLRDWHDEPAEASHAAGAMRTLHTLKGGARLAGAMRLGELAHRLESGIEHAAARRHDPSAADIEALQARADTLAQTFDALCRREPAPLDAGDVVAANEPEAKSATAPPVVAPAPAGAAARVPAPTAVSAAARAAEADAGARAGVGAGVGLGIVATGAEAEARAGTQAEMEADVDTAAAASAAAPASIEPSGSATARATQDEAARATPIAAPPTDDAAAVPAREAEPPRRATDAALAFEAPFVQAPLAGDAADGQGALDEPVQAGDASPGVAPTETVAEPVTGSAPEPAPEPASQAVTLDETRAEAPPAPSAAPADIDWSRFDDGADDAAAPGGTPRAVPQAAVRVRAPLLDRLVNQSGEISITRARIESEVGQFKGSLGDLTDNLERLRGQLRDIELHGETQMSSRLESAKAAAQAFDPLEFDRFTRFQEVTRMMAESVNDVATVQRSLQRALEGAEDALAAQARLARDLQDDLLRTRMVEFEGASDRLYRVVRQAAKETGKQVRLDIVGGSIEIDRGVLDRMTGAFEHLLRNSVAHGVELPAVRVAAGKPAVGQITLTVGHEGNEVAVEVRDDGAGLDLARIRAKAGSLGLIDPAQPHSDAELANLIFAAGFSTAEQVTELAGRGVGMDAVRAEVNAIGGRIETATEAGVGTAFKLVLPLTTAVTQVVMLRCGASTLAVPSTLVEVVLRLPAADAEVALARGQFEHAGHPMPYFWLGALLQGAPRSHEAEGRTRAVLVVRSAAQRVAVQVDEVLGNQEVVVKNLGPQLSRMPGLAGVTLLASGAVALIYNPVALATLYGAAARAATLAAGPAMTSSSSSSPQIAGAPPSPQPAAAPAVVKPPLILVVDDSLTVRRVTQRLLEREGYRVALAKDGLDALERLVDEKPALVLSDIEMPRMDGFDLVRNIRGDARWRDLTVVMITSRIAQKHREHAAELGVDHYLGKPYDEQDLLALIGRHTARVAAAR